MTNTLPVPSKGALRALRNIALGTSCTVAISAGLLTEDRRRRIHAARAVQQNGQRIKCSKNYHGSAGADAIAALEEHVQSPEYFTGNKKGHILPPPDTWKSWPVETHSSHETTAAPATAKLEPPAAIPNKGVCIPKAGLEPDIWHTGLHNRSAEDVEKEARALLEKGSNGVLLAISVVQRHLKNLDGSKDAESLVEICSRIYEWCHDNACIEAYIPLLKQFLSMANPPENLFERLHATEAVIQLLRSAETEDKDAKYESALETATFIFMCPWLKPPPIVDQNKKPAEEGSAEAEEVDTIPESPLPFPSEQSALLESLIHRLFTMTYEAQMWHETAKVCQKALKLPISNPKSCSGYLVLARNKLGNHGSAIHNFTNHFALSKPPKDHFDQVVGAALDSSLERRKINVPEKVLSISAEMARARGFKIRAEWPLKVLRQQWKFSRNLERTEALMDGLETLIDVVDVPEAIYSAMVQFCIEDRQIERAYFYLDKQTPASGVINSRVSINNAGHFALACAMEGDWPGVKSRFLELLSGKLALRRTTVSEIFPPIFKLYTESHDAREAAAFLQEFMEMGVKLHQYAFNTMIDKFAAAKDMDSIIQWFAKLELPELNTIKVTSVTFNAILCGLRDEAAMPYIDLVRLVQAAQAHDASTVDDRTFHIIREAALRTAKGRRGVFALLMRKLNRLNLPLDRPTDNHTGYLANMRAAMGYGSYTQALRIYKNAVRDRYAHISEDMMNLAVKACLSEINVSRKPKDDYYRQALDLVAKAEKRGINVQIGLTRLLLFDLDQPMSRERFFWLMDTNLARLAQKGFDISMDVILHAASVLVNQGSAEQALALWMGYVSNRKIPRREFDISSLTLLVRIEAALKKTAGLEWVFETMALNKIVPNETFCAVMRESKRKLKKELYERNEDEEQVLRESTTAHDVEFYKQLEQYLRMANQQRAVHAKQSQAAAAHLLEIMAAASREAGDTPKKGADIVLWSSEKGDDTLWSKTSTAKKLTRSQRKERWQWLNKISDAREELNNETGKNDDDQHL